MKISGNIKDILRLRKTILTFKEICLIWNETNLNAARSKINYYVKKGELINLRRGLYAVDKNYNEFELAVKIYKPSYISFETVLFKEGIIFQYYESTFVASYLSKNIIIDNHSIIFRKIKYPVLINNPGVEINDDYSIASPERALLDILYIDGTFHFDNLENLDKQKVFEYLKIYDNKRLNKTVYDLFK